MQSNYLRPIVAFDVDDTLIGDNEEPRPEVVMLFKLLQKFGCRMIVWSNGGSHEESTAYARRICQKLGLTADVLEKGSIRADIVVDDLDIFTRVSEGTLGLVNIKV